MLFDGRPAIFIGGECSGRVRRALWKRGAFVVSCDHKPAEDLPLRDQWSWLNGGHRIGDMCDVVDMFAEQEQFFDAGLWHPVCTYLTHSAAWAYGAGPYHQKVKPGTLVGAARRAERERQLAYCARIWALPVPVKIVENPGASALSYQLGKPAQIIQPYQLGDDASKATGLWMLNAEPIEVPPPAEWCPPRMVNGLPRWSNQTDSGQNRLSPSPDRTADRSRTFPGVAEFLAETLLRNVTKASL